MSEKVTDQKEQEAPTTPKVQQQQDEKATPVPDVISEENSPDKFIDEVETAAETNTTQTVDKKQSDFFVADNTHLIVEEKLEKIRLEKEQRENARNQKLEDEGKEVQKKKPQNKLILCTQQCRYRIIKKSFKKLEFKLNEDDTIDWDLYWSDTMVQPQRIQKMQTYQRINHYPGMQNLAHKHLLCRNLKRMQKIFFDEYDFFPKTWILPSDSTDFKQQFTHKKAKTFIVKPVAACQGRGIYLTRDFEKIDMKAGEQYVVQRYMHKPYLIDGLKFDMRIYVLVYGIDPLRVFVFREGLARFATEEYVGPQKSNLDNLYMHLTNYAINKKSEAFEANEGSEEDDVGHKRSVSSVFKLIEENEKEKGITSESLWKQIDDIAIKTMISAQPSIAHAYRSLQPDDLENSMCFEILGIDIFLDDKLKPWLIEVNSLPSFATDSPLDKKIKYDVVYETIAMLNMNQKRKRRAKREKTLQFERRQQFKDAAMTKEEKDDLRKKLQQSRDIWDQFVCSGFVRVYPPQNKERYEQYKMMIDYSKQIFNDFTSGISRQYQQNGFVRADPRNMAKTNPLVKGKANDLDLSPQLPPTSLSPQKQYSQEDNKSHGQYILNSQYSLDVKNSMHFQSGNPQNLRFQNLVLDNGDMKSRIHQNLQYSQKILNNQRNSNVYMPHSQERNHSNSHQSQYELNKQLEMNGLHRHVNSLAQNAQTINADQSMQQKMLKAQMQMMQMQQGHPNSGYKLRQAQQNSELGQQKGMNLQQNQAQSNYINQAPPKLECIAKTLQKQFPLIRLEQSLLVNGCMNSCPIHGKQNLLKQVKPNQFVSQNLPGKPNQNQNHQLHAMQQIQRMKQSNLTQQDHMKKQISKFYNPQQAVQETMSDQGTYGQKLLSKQINQQIQIKQSQNNQQGFRWPNQNTVYAQQLMGQNQLLSQQQQKPYLHAQTGPITPGKSMIKGLTPTQQSLLMHQYQMQNSQNVQRASSQNLSIKNGKIASNLAHNSAHKPQIKPLQQQQYNISRQQMMNQQFNNSQQNGQSNSNKNAIISITDSAQKLASNLVDTHKTIPGDQYGKPKHQTSQKPTVRPTISMNTTSGQVQAPPQQITNIFNINVNL